ncbi:GNAT family N-acetyltransferase [Dysgonomonas sp. ZJ709]|uniref:GNAT family N-acetyltransferase n=1 Tax=Dysgonomonas sp. ZJ709 TaxID=2709797 RepID=UPI0013EB80DE|nr:GNAT family N-acetyltransferase [Dysgonomonas sp. ZJ709]
MSLISIRKATQKDIEDLVQLRIDFLKVQIGHLSENDESIIRDQSRSYYSKHISLGDFVAILACKEGKIVSTAFLMTQERPASPSFISGITGTLLNVLTYKEYQRQGIATQVIQAIIEEAKAIGVTTIDLIATEDGKDLYKQLGFSSLPYETMRLING